MPGWLAGAAVLGLQCHVGKVPHRIDEVLHVAFAVMKTERNSAVAFPAILRQSPVEPTASNVLMAMDGDGGSWWYNPHG